MKISILCSNASHPVNGHIDRWVAQNAGQHDISVLRRKADLPGGDILFLISSSEIITRADRDRYQASLVLHAADLPHGRGWSPHIWEITGGAKTLTLSMLEAEDKVDSGRIWKKAQFAVPGHALWDEINTLLFDAELDMMDFAITSFGSIVPEEQSSDIEPSYYPRRTPEDSRIDPDLGIREQFDLIRVCDPERFPAFFDMNGCRYKLILEKLDDKRD